MILLFLLLSIFPLPSNTQAMDVDKHDPTTESIEVCLSKEEKKLYDMMMRYRATKGLGKIPLSPKLTKVAKLHAIDLQENFNLKNVKKCNPHSWSKNGDWTSCCYTNDHAKAECMWEKPKEIAEYEGYGYEIAYYSSKGASAEEGLEGWKKSPGHNPLIINSGIWEKIEWQAMGIGFYGEYGIVWFGEQQDTELLTNCR